jgi:perosamine synthetase
MNKYKIPVYKPFLNGNEKEYVNKCLDEKWISSRGQFIEKFEISFSKYINVKYSTSVSNGTVALHLALKALDIGFGDEVIAPTFTYVASINAIQIAGAKPVFVDCLEDSWNIDYKQITSKINHRTKAIMVVHMYGLSCNMDEILKICKKYNLYLIEDAAEAFGSFYKSKHVGTFGDISTFSFFGNKTITTGEGGMISTNNINIINRCKYLKSQAVSIDKEYWHDEIGYNYRMTNICAAIGTAQLESRDVILQKKNLIATWYKKKLKGLPLNFQLENSNFINSHWLVCILLNDDKYRNSLRDFLSKEGVETRPFFYPVHIMPAFKTAESFPISESISKRGINLPSYPSITNSQVTHICNLIKAFFKKC